MVSTISDAIDYTANARSTISAVEAQRRLKQRRQMLLLQAASYAVGDIIVLIYAYAGKVSLVVPSMFFSAASV